MLNPFQALGLLKHLPLHQLWLIGFVLDRDDVGHLKALTHLTRMMLLEATVLSPLGEAGLLSEHPQLIPGLTAAFLDTLPASAQLFWNPLGWDMPSSFPQPICDMLKARLRLTASG